MPVITKLIRKVPGPYLQEYFESKNLVVPPDFNWEKMTPQRKKALLAAIQDVGQPFRDQVRTDFEHIDGMSDEMGQDALKHISTTEQQAVLAEIENGHARALWMFVHHNDQFRHAEGAATFDRAKNKNTWDSFAGPIGLMVNREEDARRILANEIAEIFKVDGKVRVRVEVFDRASSDEEGQTDLVQVVVLHEGQTVAPLVFANDDDDTEPETTLLPHRPVGEIGFTYDPANGNIEVVAQKRGMRAQLAHRFAKVLLGQDIELERMEKRRYDLSVFLTDREFAVDPEDKISAVRLMLVKFLHDDGRAFVTVENKGHQETIHVMADRLFQERNPFLGGYSIHEAVLAVSFQRDAINPRGRTVGVRLRDPNGCSIGETCAKERLIRRKYLSAWGIAVPLENDE